MSLSFVLSRVHRSSERKSRTGIERHTCPRTCPAYFPDVWNSLGVGNYLLPRPSRRFLNLSTRPPASTYFCLPVKKGWHLEQMSTRSSPLASPLVERVVTDSPQAQRIVTSLYSGWIPAFIVFTSFRRYSRRLVYHSAAEIAIAFAKFFTPETVFFAFFPSVALLCGSYLRFDLLFQPADDLFFKP